jgi:ectoine hydroxylase-related dioxygenase (phytanoyl-CoA dioxygenase family)
MIELVSDFERDGCVVIPNAVAAPDLANARSFCDSVVLSGAGTRDLLEHAWCRAMAHAVRSVPEIHALLGTATTAIQCTLFVKDTDHNWLVPLHRDWSIPVKARVASSRWSAWSMKQSVVFGRPPPEVLQRLVAVRVHLEDTDVKNGALQVVNGSHQTEAENGERSSHFVSRGGALVMRPLLLHASSKLVSGSRRVLHFVYGPPTLPDGAEWANAV